MSERDIVERLRKYIPLASDDSVVAHVDNFNDAADEIERLREALRSYLFAEQIDDEMQRQAELSVARQVAEALLAGSPQ